MAHGRTVKVDNSAYSMPRSAPDPIDMYVGNRLRCRRMRLGLTLTKLGDRMGLTSQQIQKYEKGKRRISASRLFELSQLIDVPVEYFFEGIPSAGKSANREKAARDSDALLYKILSTRDALELNQAFTKIKDIGVRKLVIDLVRSLGR